MHTFLALRVSQASVKSFMMKVDAMYTLNVSSKGRIVLPTEVRKRLRMGLGAQLELSVDADGLRLRVLAARPSVDISHMAGKAGGWQRACVNHRGAGV
jgi:AbrB family looped-hinge helix DNA binding protein